MIKPVDICENHPVKSPVVAVDTIGAGIGELVLCLFGHAASIAAGGKNLPVDAAIAGIVDGYEIEEMEG